ncbi:hypothetical protein ABZ354_08735 [Streptomyces sp. NPDC005925]|uniref:hypothetical protein n=1 Tax=Streptomyces sp. NPDC005925 TaxID=3157172 RepID=UPI0033CE58BB
MATSVRPRRVAAFAVLAAAASTLAVTPTAVAAPGDNGDVKIHVVGADPADPADESRVCKFYLAAFNFDTVRQIAWTIRSQPVLPGVPVRTGTLTLQTGTGATPSVSLPDGRYRLTWSVVGGVGPVQGKAFTVDCPDDPTVPPNGGPPAGGGGLARDAAFTPVAGAAGVGLAAVVAVAWLRFRRRAHGPAS